MPKTKMHETLPLNCRISNKRRPLLFPLAIALFLALFFVRGAKAHAATYYIDPGCSVNGNGTTTDTNGQSQVCASSSGGAGPFNTWASVAWAAGNTYLQRGGTTFHGEVTVGASGTAENPITLGSYGSTNAIIQPTTTLSSWTRVGDTNVYYASLATTPTQVFISGSYVQPAHWPTNVGASTATYESTTSAGTTTHLVDTGLSAFTLTQLTGAEIWLYIGTYMASGWAIETATITGFDGEGTATASPAFAPATRADQAYYLTAPPSSTNTFSNKSWMMTANTWFYDQTAQLLYVWAPSGGSPGSVDVSTINYGVYALDKSYVTVNDITVQYAAKGGIFFDTSAGNITGITVSNCALNWDNSFAVAFSHYPSYNVIDSTVTNCTSDHTASAYVTGATGTLFYSAISVFNGSSGDSVTNNIITNVGMYPILPADSAGALMGYPVYTTAGMTITGNTITNILSTGITMCMSDSLISENTVTNTNLNPYLTDGGGIYIAGLYHPLTFADSNEVSYNTLTNAGKGIYYDQPSSNGKVHNNTVIAGAMGEYGMLFHDALNMIVYDNFIIGPFGFDIGVIVHEDYDYSSDVSPLPVPTNSYFHNNIIVAGGSGMTGLEVIGPYTPGAYYVFNNDFEGMATGVYSGDDSGLIAAIENNIFHNNTINIYAYEANASSINYNDYYPNTGNDFEYNNVTEPFLSWKSLVGSDVNSLSSDPLFTDGSGSYSQATDFVLQSGSPCVNAGVNVGLTTDYAGNPVNNPPSIGAYEFEANFGLPQETITASAGTGGTISPSGSVSVNYGANQSFAITPSAEYAIASVAADGSSVGAVSSYTFNDVTSNHTITASFTPVRYTVAITTRGTGSGTVSISPTGTSFPAGTVVTLTANPASNSTFGGWSGACSGDDSSCLLTMNGNERVTATFQGERSRNGRE